jgi:hypothetical protein
MGVPAWLSTSPRPQKALRQVRWAVAVFVLVWGYLCVRLYPELVFIK